MNNIQKLKTATIISFLIIIFPGPHVWLLNCMVLGIMFLQPFFFIGIDPIDMQAINELLLSGLSLLSLVLIFKKSRLLTLGCILIQYLWLFYAFNKDDLNNIYYLSTMGLYLLLSLILMICLFKKKNGNVLTH